MNVFEFVLLIVLIVTIGRLVERRSGRHGRRNAAESTSADTEDTAARMASLEERIRVLEHIVTDEGYELRKKFRDLED